MSKAPQCLRVSSVIVGCSGGGRKLRRHGPPAGMTKNVCLAPNKCQSLFQNGRTKTVSSLFARLAHTDIKVPSFDAYRPKNQKCAEHRVEDAVVEKKVITGALGGTLLTVGLSATNDIVYTMVRSMAASADVLAMSKIEIKLTDIPEGKTSVLKWRGKPLFVKHRTPEEIEQVKDTDLSLLRDPQKDEDRCKRPEFLVLVGVCTHLGCVPSVVDHGDYPGGFYCPCHGSHYDGSGRVRKGPAPANLEVPYYEYPDENTLVVG